MDVESPRCAVIPAGPGSAGPVLAAWRLAYLITGDRLLARRLVDEARVLLGDVEDLPLLRAAVVGRARTASAACRHDALWSALQHLPRRERAAIVSRLAG